MAAPIGIKPRVREFLSRGDGTALDIAHSLGITVRQASQALSSLRVHGGAFKVEKNGNNPIYSAHDPNANRSMPKKYVAPMRELTINDYDIGAHRKLAMLVR